MSKSRPHVRHLFPTGDRFLHDSTAYCRCRPHRRTDKLTTVYIHQIHGDEKMTMTKQDYRDPDGVFTVVLPEVLRARFERWLRREHLQMAEAPSGIPNTYVVISPPAGRR